MSGANRGGRRVLVGAVAAMVLARFAAAQDPWPQFRGPAGDGQSQAVGLPLHWSDTQHVRWQTPIHGRGHSSPVIWGDQVWLTTATPDGHEMFAVAVDRNSGKVLLDLKLFDVQNPQPAHALNSYASPTPVIEAGRVYMHFGTYGTACLDTETGRPIWVRRNLHCNHFRGPGSSPFLAGDLLVLVFDGFDVQYLVALDKRTGKTVWKTDRSTDFGTLDGDMRKAYCTPITLDLDGRTLLISPGAKAAMAYELLTGKEVWKIRYAGFSNTSRPVCGLGLVFINTGFGNSELWAVRPDGHGDVTSSHVVWKFKKGVPQKPSPLLIGERIFFVSDGGLATWLTAKTGEKIWQERIGGQFSASPLYADGRIYCCSHDGKTTVLAAADTFRVLAENSLSDGFMASPAVSGKALFLRTKTRLLRIEE